MLKSPDFFYIFILKNERVFMKDFQNNKNSAAYLCRKAGKGIEVSFTCLKGFRLHYFIKIIFFVSVNPSEYSL